MSKEKIHTIPVLDAFNGDSECPFCSIYETLEQNLLEFVLGNSYMEEDIREETNRLGFCKEHYHALFQGKNSLGLALILQTHMQKLERDFNGLLKASNKQTKSGLFGKKSSDTKLTDYTSTQLESCYICERIKNTFDIYMDTFFYLWKSEADFKDKVSASKGFCLHHFAQLYDMAFVKLNSKSLEEFVSIVIPLQQSQYQRVMGDIDWFITKFDYRYADAPWKNSQDALQRALKKISGLKL